MGEHPNILTATFGMAVAGGADMQTLTEATLGANIWATDNDECDPEERVL